MHNTEKGALMLARKVVSSDFVVRSNRLYQISPKCRDKGHRVVPVPNKVPFLRHLFEKPNLVNFRPFSSKMRCLPFEISDIPLTGCPLAHTVKLSVESLSSISSLCADLVVATVSAPLESKNEENKDAKAIAKVNEVIDGALNRELSGLIERRSFSGKEGKTEVTKLPEASPFIEAGVLGLGTASVDQTSILEGYDMMRTSSLQPLSPYSAAKLGKPLAALLSTTKAKSLVLVIESSRISPTSLQSLVESLIIAQCPEKRFKSKKDDSSVTLESVVILVDGDIHSYQSVVEKSSKVATGVQLARELANAPPNMCNPETLAKAAVRVAEQVGLAHKVLGKDECIKRKMGAYLAVNQGSVYQPQFIHLTYKPGGEVKKRIAFVGKGICMDTGGYNLKIQCGIETMKFDMAGAAAVIGAAQIIGSLKPKDVEVHFIVAAAENMVDAASYRPGDIVTASDGTTIETNNTDCEGRMTLADALVYAETEVKPDVILDCATLTGACIVGLGPRVAALYSTSDQLMSRILESAQISGCAIWPLPLFGDYRPHNDGKCADLSNLSTLKGGGSITAALFLKHFVKKTPWAHIDLAGPVWSEEDKDCTGYGAKLLAQIVCLYSQ